MAKVDQNTLENLIKKAGLHKSTADRLREANNTEAEFENPSRPKGHGSPRPVQLPSATL